MNKAHHKYKPLQRCVCGREDKLHKSGLCAECERQRLGKNNRLKHKREVA